MTHLPGETPQAAREWRTSKRLQAPRRQRLTSVEHSKSKRTWKLTEQLEREAPSQRTRATAAVRRMCSEASTRVTRAAAMARAQRHPPTPFLSPVMAPFARPNTAHGPPGTARRPFRGPTTGSSLPTPRKLSERRARPTTLRRGRTVPGGSRCSSETEIENLILNQIGQ